MEGKELYSNEDEELDPKSKKEEEDADDFGLPEIEDSDNKSEDLGDPYPESWEDKKEEESLDFANTNDDFKSDADDIEPDYSDNIEPDYSYNEEVDDNLDTTEDEEEEDYRSSYYEEEYGRKKSPVGWIIFGVIVLIAIIIGVFWWMNRDEPAPETTVQPQVQQPVIQESEPEPEPVAQEPEPEPEPVKQPGVFEINAPTDRYHVIVASSIDKDLVHDYGNRLAKQGMTCNILAPRGNKKFHRLSVADFVSLNDAAIKSEQLKHTLGEDVWVIRY